MVELYNKCFYRIIHHRQNQSGNLKFSIFISKTHLLHFLCILDVKDIILKLLYILYYCEI